MTTFKAEGINEVDPYVYVTGTDRCIREIKGFKKTDHGEGIGEGIVLRVFEQSFNLS